MMLETQKNMCGRAGCFGKKLCPQNLENGAKMGQKHVYEFIEKFGHYFQRIGLSGHETLRFTVSQE